MTRDDDGRLVFTMTGAPTFVHAIERYDANSVFTRVESPAEQAGAGYTLTRRGNLLDVILYDPARSGLAESVNQWDACG
ncbi:MAG: hypothetical protein NW203_01375 [Hyphomonadaceae bacterium]|nr:hypothetical protein [Hyphomonadaceae bacterium]